MVKVGIVSTVLEEHGLVRAGRCRLPEIVSHGNSIRRSVNDEPAPAEIARGRMRDREGEGRGCRSVQGVAAVAQHLDADARGDRGLGYHHAVVGADGFGEGGVRR